MSTSRPINFVRWLLLTELGALLVSTSLAVGVEFLLYISFVVFAPLRSRLRQVVAQPMVLMLFAWAAILVIAGFYSVASAAETLDNLSSWRKLLLLPMAAAVFDDELWKRRLVWALVLITAIGAALSYLSVFSGKMLVSRHGELGVVIGDHATQGMMFAVSLFGIVMLLRHLKPASMRGRWFLIVAALLIFPNLIFITPGRSGYLVLLILAIITSFSLVSGVKRIIMAVVVPLLVLSMLLFSPVARQRITQGIDEIRSYQTSSQLTSMGVRMVMWQNTMALIKERPWLGYGTGGFSDAYSHQVSGREGWQGQGVDDPHNQFLRIVAEQGILGLLVFLLFIGAFFRQPVRGVYRVLGLGVLLSWCATSMFSAHFSTFTVGRFFYIWCGSLLALSVVESEETENAENLSP